MKQILIIDGNAETNDIVGVLLSNAGCQVSTISDIGQSLEFKRGPNFDLVVIDIDSVDSSGPEVVEWVRHNVAFAQVVLLSGKKPSVKLNNYSQKERFKVYHKGHLKKIFNAIVRLLNAKPSELVIHDITLFNVLQHCISSNCSKSVGIHHKRSKAEIVIHNGSVTYAQCGKLIGEKAFYKIMAWENPDFFDCQVNADCGDNIELDNNTLMIEAFMRKRAKKKNKTNKRRDSTSGRVAKESAQGKTLEQEKISTSKGENNMKESLARLKDLDGFIAAGAFSAEGEMLAEVSSSDMHLAEVGALANDVLLKAQKSTDIMGVGRGNVVHIAAPKANILVRCLNENTDYSSNEAGRAHVHLVLVMEADGNIALGKMLVEKVILQVAESVR
ncbi:MAG: response regulator [Desulfuromonadales bacterium]|nr:response regulator [Desulfuromonadales bacterium]